MKKKIPYLILSVIVFIIGCISIYPSQTSRIVKYINDNIKSNGFFNSILTRETNIDSDDLTNFLDSVTITDSDGNPIDDNILHVGSKYNITISFKEQGATGAQFKPSGEENSMTYTFPPNFNIPPISNQKLEVEVAGQPVEIGSYSIDENGKLVINFTEQGMQAIAASTDLDLVFSLQAILKAITGDPDESTNFGSYDDSFTFQVDNNPDLSLEKIGSYNGSEQLLSYQVTAKVSSGTLNDVEIEDNILPYNNDAIKIKIVTESIKVKLKRGGTEIDLTTDDYEVECLDDMHFKIKIKGTSQYQQLLAGDELIVNYDYKTEFVETQTGTYYATVINAAEFGGNVIGPDGSKTPSSTGGSTTLHVSPVAPNNVSIIKKQEWNPDTKTLTYRIYAEVKAGTYFNFWLNDYLNVYYELASHSLTSQLIKGDVKVYATDIEDYEMFSITNSDSIIAKYENKLEQLKVIKNEELINGTSYDPKDMNSVIFSEGQTATSYFFGYDKDKGTSSYSYGKNRFFKFEYQIDLSDGVTFYDSDQKLTFEELLKVGITNSADLRYNNYESFNEVYFAKGNDLEKKAVVNNRKNTIDYTVSIDVDDTENYYFIKRICEEFYTPWGESVTFVDDYDDGFEYVEGTLKLIYKFKDGTYLTFNYVGNDETGERWRPEQYNDPDLKKGRIQANYRSFLLSHEESTHDIVASDYPENYLYGRMEIDSIDFVYTLQAKDSWLKEHANDDNDTIVKNKAMMTTSEDPTGKDFHAENEVPFFPARVLKDAEQEGNSNLIHFTLKINPNAIDLDKTSSNLTITDTSSGISIQYDTISITDENGEVVEYQLINDEDDHVFKLIVPDNKALTIKYDAITYLKGNEVSITNSVQIANATRSEDTYSKVLEVSSTSGGGGGSAFELTIKKVDSKDKNKVLKNAKFKFYLVVPEGSALEATDKIGDYNVYSEDNWNIETNSDGKFKIEKAMNWRLEGGNYYILVEQQAPKGYVLDKTPILFYFGPNETVDHDNYPDARVVAPNGTITITNVAIPEELPETGGNGVLPYYAIGLIILVTSLSLYNRKRRLIGR